jgi:hypothetical protein
MNWAMKSGYYVSINCILAEKESHHTLTKKQHTTNQFFLGPKGTSWNMFMFTNTDPTALIVHIAKVKPPVLSLKKYPL